METERKDAATTGSHSRCSTQRNNASVIMLPDAAEQHLSKQDTFRPRGCPCPKEVDLISSTNNSSTTVMIGGNQKHNNRGWNETQ